VGMRKCGVHSVCAGVAEKVVCRGGEGIDEV
jgi:hypothetical protein